MGFNRMIHDRNRDWKRITNQESNARTQMWVQVNRYILHEVDKHPLKGYQIANPIFLKKEKEIPYPSLRQVIL